MQNLQLSVDRLTQAEIQSVLAVMQLEYVPRQSDGLGLNDFVEVRRGNYLPCYGLISKVPDRLQRHYDVEVVRLNNSIQSVPCSRFELAPIAQTLAALATELRALRPDTELLMYKVQYLLFSMQRGDLRTRVRQQAPPNLQQTEPDAQQTTLAQPNSPQQEGTQGVLAASAEHQDPPQVTPAN